MSVDMELGRLRFNRDFLQNAARPDYVLLTKKMQTDTELEGFYNRWEDRHQAIP
jgi:hypothetical protein